MGNASVRRSEGATAAEGQFAKDSDARRRPEMRLTVAAEDCLAAPLLRNFVSMDRDGGFVQDWISCLSVIAQGPLNGSDC